jgi:hypothetical protein
MALLEGCDRCTYRRLTQIHRLGRTRDMLPLCDRNKDSKLLKRHNPHRTGCAPSR